ncbi:hypothetical protein Mtc_0588 [Methanocella conradii HZ254]|uniref:Uncharacterized protein n=1 Tax=Methanocella conradii (strain DSM 24694 / JCM 17849 / CGMCC 1.5162 / HZ254) TaxID=1041930 RepID=H8I5N3_METCZ|nr:hypothetical protein Mtc_0588 [Methanocella conradii HZ254]
MTNTVAFLITEYTKNIERNYTTEATEIIFTTEVHRGHRDYIHHRGSQRTQRNFIS